MTDKRKLSLNSVGDLSGDFGMAMVNFDNLVHCVGMTNICTFVLPKRIIAQTE